MKELRSCGDVLMIPLGLKGHITPMMYVAKGLMKRGITITVVIPVDQQVLLETDMEDGMEGFNVQLVPSLNDVEGREYGIMLGLAMNLERACEAFLNKLLAELDAGVKGPKCVVADQFLGWTQIWADKLRVPRYVSFPSPATYAVTMLNHSSIMAQWEKARDKDQNPAFKLPGIPELHLSDLPVSFRDPGFRERVVKNSGESFRQAAGMLFNTFYELESKAIDTFRAQVESTSSGGQVTKMLSIGPMLPPAFFSEGTFVGGTAKNSECLKWLDTQRVSSVLYIAFGSITYLSAAQIQELAHGLEASQVPFLWILRVKSSNGQSGDVTKLLPPGFQERTKERGLVHAEFAPQLQILSHPATGGFLTHCGWNSCLESICRGIPTVGWPMWAEQGLSCRLLVDVVKVATEFKKKPDGSVERGEVERAIRLLMTASTREELKQRVSELRLQARAARAPGGSSHADFEWFVKEILGQK